MRCRACEAGKIRYHSRRNAKQVIRRIYPGEHFSAFRCGLAPNYWHIGHLPPEVARGTVTRGS